MKKKTFYIFSVLFLIFIYLISFFIKVKIGRIYTSRVGHLCKNLDIYLYNKNNFCLTFFSTDKFISNKKILEIIKRNSKFIFFSRFFFYPFKILESTFKNSNLLLRYFDDLHPQFSLKSKSKALLSFNNKEEKIGNNILLEENLRKRNYIVFHNREELYLKKLSEKIVDRNTHIHRNFPFNDYLKTIRYCKKKNIKVLRLGVNSEKDNTKKLNLYKSFTDSDYDEFKSLYLISKSKFVITGNSGFQEIASSFRVPVLMINGIPFFFNELYSKSCRSIVIPKKIYSLKKKKFLKINEIINLNYNIHYKGDFFLDNGLKYFNNTETEILESFKEMLEKLNNLKNYYKKYNNIKKKIDKVFVNNKYYSSLLHDLDINISYSFLNRNKFLI